jgi:hypothetical protein
MFQAIIHQVMSVATNPQLDGSKSTYVVSDVDVQETAVTVIKNEYVDVIEQKLDVAVDHESMFHVCVISAC